MNDNTLTLINDFLADKGIYMLSLILFFLGMYGIIVCGNYMKKLMCMNIMHVAVILFFLCFAQKEGGTIPVTLSDITDANAYINPLPHALVLTIITVGLGTTGVGIALLMKIKDSYGTIEEDEIVKIKKEDEFNE